MTAPAPAVGDGCLGFWAVLFLVYPKCTGQRCRVDEVRSVPARRPKRLQAMAKKHLPQSMDVPEWENVREE